MRGTSLGKGQGHSVVQEKTHISNSEGLDHVLCEEEPLLDPHQQGHSEAEGCSGEVTQQQLETGTKD